ncbi:carboxymuconolactone decarboxylase family protein [Pseudoalteromonas aurantia]|uniref:Alkylhydroperoxidase n=1 Tax=Pseudoalteromonas aurantia TaxID=43654 RepID=A0A5S3V846_9GAMM|nr:carboxymuconolactone decarboxylase family protein [Pseudoalteromonas aurantia]TMO67966.1 alkylhydroperoxidase [Pseudoalteromonas aurantia]
MHSINYHQLAPNALNILLQQEAYLKNAFNDSQWLSLTLWDLVKMRVSQMNRCAYCIEMHSQSALAQGESLERLLALNAWQNSSLFTKSEKAILHWAERITNNADVGSEELSELREHLDERSICDLTFAINAINSWNRVARAFNS